MQYVNARVVMFLWLSLGTVPYSRELPETLVSLVALIIIVPVIGLVGAIIAESVGWVSLVKLFGEKH